MAYDIVYIYFALRPLAGRVEVISQEHLELFGAEFTVSMPDNLGLTPISQRATVYF